MLVGEWWVEINKGRHLGGGIMGKRLQKLFLAMAIVFVIPIVALGVSYAVSAKYKRELR